MPTTRDPGARPTSRSEILASIASGTATSRRQLIEATGLGRAAVQRQLDGLLGLGAIEEHLVSPEGRGRPHSEFRLRPGLATVGAIDIRRPISTVELRSLAVDQSPSATLEFAYPNVEIGERAVVEALRQSADDLDVGLDTLIGLGISVESGGLTADDDVARIRHALRSAFDTALVVDHAANAAALAEWQARDSSDLRSMLFIRLGREVRSTLIVDGTIHRGTRGAAGDIGHARVPDRDGPLCRCGQRGCLDRIASTIALSEQLRDAGAEVAADGSDVSDLVRAGDTDATRMARSAGRAVGAVVALLVNLTNPETIVVGGVSGPLLQHMIAGLRERVYERATPLATRELTISEASFGEDSARVGAAHFARRAALTPAALERLVLRLERAHPVG